MSARKIINDSHIDSEKLKSLRIFAASPSYMEVERLRVSSIVEDLRPLSKHVGLSIEVLDWHMVIPGMGRPEQVILDQFNPDTWDLFIGILWHNFGSPPGAKDPLTRKEYLSGTEEEFNIAYRLWQHFKRPRVMFYRCTRDVPLEKLDSIQLERVKIFFTAFGANAEHPGLHQTFDSLRSFENRVRNDLIRYLIEYSEKIKGHIITQEDIQEYLSSRDNLPERKAFFGRDRELKLMMDALGPHEVGWGVVIDGIGGIGKTALAIEVAHRCKNLGVFDAYIFNSAKQMSLNIDQVYTEPISSIISLDDLINQTANVLGKHEIVKLKGENKRRALLAELRGTRALLIFDNVETFPESEQDLLVDWLRFLPRDSKAIITSRRRLSGRALPLHLREVDWETATDIIKYEANKNVYLRSILKGTTETELRELYEETGGSPLALIWILCMISYGSSDFGNVINLLRNGLTGESGIKKYIYEGAIKEISAGGISVLSALSLFTPAANIDSLVVVTNQPRWVVKASLERLIALSLVNESSDMISYTIHPLTRSYVRENLLLDVNYLNDLGFRFSRCWVDFAIRFGSSNKTFDQIESEWLNLTAAFEWIKKLAGIENNTVVNKNAARMGIEFANGLRGYLQISKRWNEGSQFEEFASQAASILNEAFFSVFTVATTDERTDISLTPILSGKPTDKRTKISQKIKSEARKGGHIRMVDIIVAKMDGIELTSDTIEFFIRGFTRGDIPDYQASALLMAIMLNGMTIRETADLTLAMAKSGEVIDLSDIVDLSVSKHSTGGVGDKTSLVVLPVVSACGLSVGKLSGRGLGFSGGTLDKMESIPGFRVDLGTDEYKKQLREVGIVLTGHRFDFAPADGKLYALRDVSGTVASIPLIASSIMSKLISAGAQAIMLDVKVGHGAFIHELNDATKLAEVMISIGELAGRKVIALLSDMNQPLGYTIGNAIEVREAIDTLRGLGPIDFQNLCLEIAARMLVLGKICQDIEEGRKEAEKVIYNGKALDKFRLLVQTQGGDPTYVDDPNNFPKAKFVKVVLSPQSGYLHQVNARILGEVAVMLGAGRLKKGDAIDHSTGLIVPHKVGDKVEKGERLFEVHANNKVQITEAIDLVLSAHTISDDPIDPLPLIYSEISENFPR